MKSSFFNKMIYLMQSLKMQMHYRSNITRSLLCRIEQINIDAFICSIRRIILNLMIYRKRLKSELNFQFVWRFFSDGTIVKMEHWIFLPTQLHIYMYLFLWKRVGEENTFIYRIFAFMYVTWNVNFKIAEICRKKKTSFSSRRLFNI